MKVKSKMLNTKSYIFLVFILFSCLSSGNLKIEASIPKDLKEVSACEITTHSNLTWVIEDSGNKNALFGLKNDGTIAQKIWISNAKNQDWEDLTSDAEGNIYIGDFGNNNHKRNVFQIYKVAQNDLSETSAKADLIEFTLPKDKKSKDFEGFFIYESNFYLFTKEEKTFSIYVVPNTFGKHIAVLKYQYNLKGKNNRITSADISNDGKTIILLNHDKLWKLSDFTATDFFSGKIKELPFKHNSQKEGLCFKDNSKVFITDERQRHKGSYIYSFDLD